MHASAVVPAFDPLQIRSTEEENEYVTYSRLLGPRGAVLLAASAQTAAFLCGLSLYLTTGLSALLPVVAGTGLAATLAFHVRFVLRPSPRTSKLGRPAEYYMVCTLLALTAASFVPPL